MCVCVCIYIYIYIISRVDKGVRTVNIYIYIYIYIYILRVFDAFRLSYSIAFDCSIRPFLDLFHPIEGISTLMKVLLYRMIGLAYLEDPEC